MARQANLPTDVVGASVDMNIVNVTSRSFGTIAFKSVTPQDGEQEEVLFNMILKNTELPARRVQEFYTVAPNQKTVTIRVLESLSSEEMADPCEGTEIGEAVLELPDGLPAGSPLQIEFLLNENGLLELTATETTHHQEVRARFETADAISEADLSAAKQRLADAMVL